jgi:acyl carrier protein
MSAQPKTGEGLRETILGILAEIAPEADLSRLKPEENLRDALDIDSLDFLHFASRLEQRLSIRIPETDYRKIATLAGCLGYLGSKTS